MKRFDSSVSARPGGRAADSFVILATALVAAAVGCGLYLQAGAGAAVSAGFAAATYLALLRLHTLRARTLRAEALNAELRRLGGEGGRLKHAAAEPQLQRPQARVPLLGNSAQGAPGGGHPEGTGEVMTSDALPSAGAPVIPAASQTAPARVQAPQVQSIEPSDDELGIAALQEFWAYRPADTDIGTPQLPMPAPVAGASRGVAIAQEPALVSVRPVTVDIPRRGAIVRPSYEAVESRSREASDLPHAALREADVEMIQNLIKKLADEVNAADAVHALSPPARGFEKPSLRAAPVAHGATTAVPNKPAAVIDASLDALRITAEIMRQAPARSQPPPLAAATPVPVVHELHFAMPHLTPPPVHPGHLHLAAIAEAVHSGRVDVLLEPIMGLGDLRARHYEVSIRLLDALGGTIAAGTGDPMLAGTSLLPLLDRTRFARTASVARRLEERGKSGGVFSEFSGESLLDERFVASAAESCRERETLGGQLVLTFAQNDLRMLSEAQWRSLDELRAMGFRFAVACVADLDMDFERLAEAGFVFVKLDSGVFLDGLKAPHGDIPPGDICVYFAGLGYTLIVGDIDSEYERSRLFGFGVLFGQGQLFGGPRPMKADALAGARHVAA